MRRWVANTVLLLAQAGAANAGSFVNFESTQIHPIALTPDGQHLLVVNTPDNRLSVFNVTPTGSLVLNGEVPVGLEPVSVTPQTNRLAWVANHLSDSVSLVDLLTQNVVATLAVGDEPTDVVLAGSSASPRLFVCVSQEDAVKVYDPASLDTPPVVVPIFGSDPRVLGVSPDRGHVYVAIFESGNQTTIASGSDVVAHGGLPAPNPKGRPDVGLILKYTNGQWVDELGRNYNDTHLYTLPDHDVAVLDALQPSLVPTYIDGLGTLNYHLGVHPTTGKLYVPNTEALNAVRFEPSLRGKFLRTRISIVDPAAPASPSIVDLNPHIDYGTTPGPQSEIDRSLSQPGAMAFGPAGEIYLTALGSGKVAVLHEDGSVADRIDVGDGPTGLALDSPRHRLYVLDRFTSSLAIVDTDTRALVSTVPLGYDPSPAAVRNGRKFLYDGRLSSGHGDLACASCHAGGNFDNIAWDLGDPNGAFQPPPPGQADPLLTGFHPMKGPMTTQSLRGLAGSQLLHWRGDRPDFDAFNPAFVSLMGRSAQFASADMQAFKSFIETIVYPPNPRQNLDRSFPNPSSGPSPERGRQAFLNNRLDGPFRCVTCHVLPTGSTGQLTDKSALQAPQDMKIPQLRNLYEKSGFATVTAPTPLKRGFGYTHDGAEPTLFDFLKLPVFTFPNDDMRRDVEAFLLTFDTGMAPAVGAQRTVTASNKNDATVLAWLATLAGQRDAANIDLIAKGRLAGQQRGWRYEGGGNFRSDRASEPLLSQAALLALAGTGTEITFTGVPPGTGTRIGIDRDEDGFFDRSEIDAGSNPYDPGSTPLTVATGPAGGRRAKLLASFPNPVVGSNATIAFELPSATHVRLRLFEASGRYVATLFDAPAGPGLVRVHWNGTDAAGRRVASGKYFYRLEADLFVQSRALLLVR